MVERPKLNGRVKIECYEHSIRLSAPVKATSGKPPPTRQAGDIKAFSRKSRRRLIKKLLRLESSRLSDAAFLSLTWHHGWSTENQEVQRVLNAFLQAFRRQYPAGHYMWRLEFQKRGAPHFHLITWRDAGAGNFDLDELERWVTETWHRLADPKSKAHRKHGADVREVESYRQASHYVSKYIGKLGDGAAVEYTGRRWGSDRGLPIREKCRLHVSESDFHILRRIMRRMVKRRGKSGRRFARHLRSARSVLIGCDGETWLKLLDYIEAEGDGTVQLGVPPPEESPGARWRKKFRRARQKRAGVHVPIPEAPF